MSEGEEKTKVAWMTRGHKSGQMVAQLQNIILRSGIDKAIQISVVDVTSQDRITQLEAELSEEKEISKKLHGLMKSGEKRGHDKALEEITELKAQLAEAQREIGQLHLDAKVQDRMGTQYYLNQAKGGSK